MARGSLVNYEAPPAATLTDPTSATTFKKSSDTTKACALFIPQMFGKVAKFRVTARGRATTAGSYNLTPAIYYGTSATATSNTSVAAASARAIATTTAPWEIVAEFLWESTTKTLSGKFTALNGSTAVLDAWAVTTAVASVDLTVPGDATNGQGFTVVNTIGTGGTCYLDEFTLEVL